jgi:prophage regulatory protein
LGNFRLFRAVLQLTLLDAKSSTADHSGMHFSPKNQSQPAHFPAQPGAQPGNYRDRLLRVQEVCFMTGLAKSSIYNAMRAGTFPAAVNLTAYAVAWRESEVDAWIASRLPVTAEPVKPPAPATRSARHQPAARKSAHTAKAAPAKRARP